jgi:transcriptional regulator with XRE-family HTH domain
MNIKEIGKAVAKSRGSFGMSQEQLANFSGLSRVTINELENGVLEELGVSKLASILSVLGLSLGVASGKPKMGGLSMAAVSASVSYKESMSPGLLMKALASGVYPPKFLPHIATLLDEAPAQLLVPAVKEASEKSGVAPKKIWQHMKHWARELQSPRSVWQ